MARSSICSKSTLSHFNFSCTSFIFIYKLIFFPQNSVKTRTHSVFKRRSKVTFLYKQPSSIISVAPAWDSFATCPCRIFFKEKKGSLCMRTRKYKYSEVKLGICFTKFGNTIIVNYVGKEMEWNMSMRNPISQHNQYFHTPKIKRIRTLSKEATELLHFQVNA